MGIFQLVLQFVFAELVHKFSSTFVRPFTFTLFLDDVIDTSPVIELQELINFLADLYIRIIMRSSFWMFVSYA